MRRLRSSSRFVPTTAVTPSTTTSAMSSALPAANRPRSVQGEGERLWFLGTLAVIRVPGEAVEDRFALVEFLLPCHASPPLHTHPQDESYVVIDGQLTIQIGDGLFQLGRGGITVVPMGVAHTFRVDSDTARVIVLSTPAGIERLVRDGSVRAGAPMLPPPEGPRPTPEQLHQIFLKHPPGNPRPPPRPPP